jgi:hypothetical protein
MATTVNKILSNNNILPGTSVDLVVSKEMVRNFGSAEDYVELHIEDPAGRHLYSIIPFLNYQIPGNFQPSEVTVVQDLEFDPATDLQDLGVSYGDYILSYNILRPKIVKSYGLSLFIKEISSDRTELRLSTNNIPNNEIEINAIDYILEFQSSPYFKEFYINFGQNRLLPAINIALDKNTNPYSVLVKLLNPLPIQYNVNSLVNIVDKISNSQQYSVTSTIDPVTTTFPTLRGPNFDLDLDNLRVGPTPYYNFNQVTNFQGNFAPQLQQLLGRLSASNFTINIDYNTIDYTDWIHFSSAARRLEGFRYKLNNIELFTSSSASLAASSTPTAQLDALNYQNQINKTIQSFDGWEQHLYYETGSHTWPKQTSVKPYINYSVTASQAISWYNSNHASASLYDDNNQNYLLYAMPGYITENDSNELVFDFVASIGQMFDDVWIHIKAITDLYQAKNALDQGISKDIVYFALQSMGINVYTNEDGENVFKYLYGVNENGTYKPITGSYETLVSASNYQMSGQDIQKGIYKRIYHSLPLLLKSKGTTRFIQYLNTIFGIPTTIMGYTEYGGVDKSTATSEYEFDRFTYGLNIDLGDTISVPWLYTSQSLNRVGSGDITPNGIEFRYKAVYSSSGHDLTSYTPQTLLSNTSGFNLDLVYTPVGKPDSIYSGSKGNFGYLEFTLGTTTVTSSTIPIFETGSNNDASWYNILVQKQNPNLGLGQAASSQTYNVYIKNNIWGEIGHVASASLTTTTQNSSWYSQGILTLGDASTTGSFQEFRLWSNYLSESKFDFHVLNPESYEGNYTSSAYNDLTARFPLGNNLATYNHSLTANVASVAPNQTIQPWTASFSGFANKNNYFSFVERYYANVANSGYANPVTDKVRIYSGSEYGTQLLPNKSIEVPPVLPITKDLHLLDASLSPQDEIDRDIIANLGSTYDIDQFIGDPRGIGYDALEDLRFDYFKKYVNKYNYKDYIRLIEFFHNSLFRTLKDFTPARTNLATGIVIKPHLLERPVVPIQSPNVSQHNNLSQSIVTAFITASNAMVINPPTYSYTVGGNLGPVNMTSDGRDFFTGELPSSSIPIHSNFVENNFNLFTIGFDNSKTSSYSESIWNVNFNPLLNNVPNNQISNTKKLLTLIGGNYGFITGSVYTTESYQYQDFTDDYYRHADPRYNGSTTTSTNYNVFAISDEAYNTYGKNAAIDKNTNKFAFFAEIVSTGSELFIIPDRSNVYIKYLVDITGSLIELAKRNYSRLSEDQKYNLYQVQNIFKSGETVNISLFDYQQPSEQANLDGNKEIFAGGFRFHPTLWRTGSYDLIYNLDPEFFPNGASGGSPYSSPEFQIVVYNENYGFANLNRRVRYQIRKISGTVAVDTVITYKVRIVESGLFGIYVDRYYTGTMIAGSNITEFSPYYNGGKNQGPNYILSIQNAGTAGQFKYRVVDTSPALTVHPSDKTIISCSLEMSKYHPGFYFLGPQVFSSNTGSNVDYRFELNKGDLIRFASGSTFIPQLEYEIVDVFLPITGSGQLTFKLNSEVNNVATSSLYSIDKFAFSRRIPDETNIVILHKKNPGITSAGIAKNINLSQNVDSKIANIVSDLKTKLF